MIHVTKHIFIICVLGLAFQSIADSSDGINLLASANSNDELAIKILETALEREDETKDIAGCISVKQKESPELQEVNFWLGCCGEYLAYTKFSREFLKDETIYIYEDQEWLLKFGISTRKDFQSYASDWAISSWIFVEPLLRPLSSFSIMGTHFINDHYQFQNVDIKEDSVTLQGTLKNMKNKEVYPHYPHVRIILFPEKKYALSTILFYHEDSFVQYRWDGYRELASGKVIPGSFNYCTGAFSDAGLDNQEKCEFLSITTLLSAYDKAEMPDFFPSLTQSDVPCYDFQRWGRVFCLNHLEPLEDMFHGVDQLRGEPLGRTLLSLACALPIVSVGIVGLLVGILILMMAAKYRQRASKKNQVLKTQFTTNSTSH